MKEKTIETILNDFHNSNIDIMKLWYDWFCKESSLTNKGIKLLKRLDKISKSKKFDVRKTYVFFKNNCPVCGHSYDDFRICDISSGDVLYTVIPKSGHDAHNGKGLVYGHENDFNGPLIEGTWKQIKEWFLK